MNINMFNGNNFLLVLNAFANNMSNDLKLSKTQISKIIQSGTFLGSLLGRLLGPLMKVAVLLGKNICLH